MDVSAGLALRLFCWEKLKIDYDNDLEFVFQEVEIFFDNFELVGAPFKSVVFLDKLTHYRNEPCKTESVGIPSRSDGVEYYEGHFTVKKPIKVGTKYYKEVLTRYTDVENANHGMILVDVRTIRRL